MRSMTGFGRAEVKNETYSIAIGIKTVNHRYKDFYIRMPHSLDALEHRIRKTLGKTIARGHADVTIHFDRLKAEGQEITVNKPLAAHYIAALKEVEGLDPSVDNRISLDLITKFPDVITVTESEIDEEATWEALKSAIESACEKLAESREKDGFAMKNDMTRRCELIAKIVADIEERAPGMLENYREHLRKTVAEYLSEVPFDEERLLTEVAIMADKLDITEEITRLKSHISRFKAVSESKEPVGRKLDFLVQEMNREVNTIGSKSTDLAIQNDVVDLKAEIEKIREQVQNIE